MELRERKENRLDGYDYSQEGAYFLTICTKQKEHYFGEVVVGAIHESPAVLPEVAGAIHKSPAVVKSPVVQLSDCGNIVNEHIIKLPLRFPEIVIDKYVVMPNHIHVIVFIKRAIRESPLRRSVISQLVGFFKANAAKEMRKIIPEISVWQRSYHDHIIRNEQEYVKIWNYIDTNPSKWAEDKYYTVGDTE